MKCAACGYEESNAKFIKVLGILRIEETDTTTNKAFYQTQSLVACPKCKTTRLGYKRRTKWKPG